MGSEEVEYKPLASGPNNGGQKVIKESGEAEVYVHIMNWPSMFICC